MKYGTYHARWFVTEKFNRVEINNNLMQKVGYTLLVFCI